SQHRGKLVREYHQNNAVEDVSELRFVGIDARLNMDLRIGIWNDVEFHYGVPLVFDASRRWRFSAGTDERNSSIVNNCITPSGDIIPNCPTAGRQPLFNTA